VWWRTSAAAWPPCECSPPTLLLLVVVAAARSVSVQGAVSSRSLTLFSSPHLERLEQWAIAGTSLAAVSVTSDGRYCVYAVFDMEGEDRTPVALRDSGLPTGVGPSALAVIDGAFTRDGRMEVVLGTPTASIIVIDSSGEQGGGGEGGEVAAAATTVEPWCGGCSRMSVQ
jgi:hypothetical protein